MSTIKLGPIQIGIILLTVATAVIHLVLGVPKMLIMFILNGIGYLGLVTALYLPQFSKYKTWVRWALIAFTAVTIIGWIAVGSRNAIGYIDKIIEIALIALLVIEMRQK